jgi:hypothetical protein
VFNAIRLLPDSIDKIFVAKLAIISDNAKIIGRIFQGEGTVSAFSGRGQRVFREKFQGVFFREIQRDSGSFLLSLSSLCPLLENSLSLLSVPSLNPL